MKSTNIRNFIAGALGGIIGAAVMTVILIGSKLAMGMPMLVDFIVMGLFVGGKGETAIPAGFLAHFLVGIVDGIIFSIIVTSVNYLDL
ncbi:hypothetical protein HRbin06_00672 [archaeon HR06]|nr:hypothetical protein HRbin06_00672 [archaeon HR06]